MIERVRATAPVRVADVGGWTDTWFGSPGQVCHLAVGPGVVVEAQLAPTALLGGPVRLVAPDVGIDVVLEGAATGERTLLGEAVEAGLEGAALPEGTGVRVDIRSAVPPGASLGTSAAVVVAVLGALDVLVGGVARSPAELARWAHEVETERAGRQSGVQDQWAAALGGAALLAVGPYPQVRHRPLEAAGSTRAELAERLVTVSFGTHDSSAVHREVIDAMVTCSGVEHHHARSALRDLSALASEAAVALEEGDVDRWAEVLRRSVDAQAALHPALVGVRHEAVIDVARRLGASGWKVNGAGGEGGSLTVVLGDHPTSGTADELAAAVAAVDPSWPVLRLAPAPGLAVQIRSAGR